jgi:DNA-binding LacI/PurR family transcriptional regulator
MKDKEIFELCCSNTITQRQFHINNLIVTGSSTNRWKCGIIQGRHMTIKDIAEMAHVSKGTVSRVINSAPGVGEETRRRVLKLIESLDFQPNPAARGLAGKRTNTLGFVIPHTGRYTITSTFWPVLLTAITEQAVSRGINVLLSTTRTEEDIDSAFRSILKGRRIDGAIIGAEQFGEKQLAELLLKNLPFVTIGRSPHISTYSVDVDNEAGARAAAEHLVALGHRRIVMLAGPENLPYIHDRVRGFQKTLSEHGLDPSRIYYCPYKTEDVVPRVASILKMRPAATALFTAAGDLVIGVLKACVEAGLSLPQDISLVSFDDHPFFAHFIPSITAVHQPVEEMGKIAVDMLFTLLEGGKPEKREVTLPTSFVVRGSSVHPAGVG